MKITLPLRLCKSFTQKASLTVKVNHHTSTSSLHKTRVLGDSNSNSRFHSSKSKIIMSDADDDLVLASFRVSNDDQTPPPPIPLLPNSQPRDLLHHRGHSINTRGGAPPPDTTFILFHNPQPHQLQDLQPGRRHYINQDYYCQDVAAAPDCPSPPPFRGSSSPRSVEAAHPLASPPASKKWKKWKTQMCSNGSACRYGSGCHFAHSKDELQKSTLHELMQDHADANDEYPYLTYPCMFQIMYEEW